jgi:hypothetical protein
MKPADRLAPVNIGRNPQSQQTSNLLPLAFIEAFKRIFDIRLLARRIFLNSRFAHRIATDGFPNPGFDNTLFVLSLLNPFLGLGLASLVKAAPLNIAATLMFIAMDAFAGIDIAIARDRQAIRWREACISNRIYTKGESSCEK